MADLRSHTIYKPTFNGTYNNASPRVFITTDGDFDSIPSGSRVYYISPTKIDESWFGAALDMTMTGGADLTGGTIALVPEYTVPAE